ncbi:activating transcription factor 7-interacting protein 1 isoform X2 [Pseudochaenichthys georgianus]|uniref:activating transcription factor 7-interacting protein 1 isoform X2 n=1 Tax=Pseudochaenichthys georgianus TaxID=52239 RepID=UPI00146A0B68|nr:activating transcription factor 7-interacting protein 1 isoform X2 [Pseudochaenichthys georgianus]
MELVVTEEKKKIFRARKTMKISDRQQLETLHSTLLTAAAGMSETASPPLMNGTHKEDGQKAGSKEPSNASDSGSPQAASPASPSTFLSLNLSPSPSSSQSSKAKDEMCSPSTSPFHSLNLELKKIEEEKSKKGSSLSSSKESVPVSSAESKENKEKESEVTPALEKEEDDKTTTKDPAKDLQKDSVEGLAPCLPPPGSNCTDPMDTDTTKAKDTEAPTTKTKVEKPSCPKTTTSDSPNTSPSSSQPASSSNNIKQDKDVKKDDGKKVKVEKEDGKKGKVEKENGKNVKGEKENGKNVKGEKEAAKKGSMNEEKMDVDIVKVETKKEKTDVGKTKKTSRPSSTPPSNTVQEEKGSTSGLKRTLSEGSQNDVEAVKREGKRPKVEREELEAQLEFKFTTKAGSHDKLEKIVQHLVEERLKALEQSLYDKHFQELKERVDKIECATKHQTAINTLQAKINRLTKKFGEANQASENKRKQEALAAVSAAASAAAASAAAASAAAAAAAAKTVTVVNSSQIQRVLRQKVELQPEGPREEVAPSGGELPVLSIKKEKEEQETEEKHDNKDTSNNVDMANELAELSEGKCTADIELRSITPHMESVLYHYCQRSSGKPRHDRYASYIFRYLVTYEIYCDWLLKVNYIGSNGKDALPVNLRRAMRMYVDRRFPILTYYQWRDIQNVINEVLRVKKTADFFRVYVARPVRTSMELKQIQTTTSPSTGGLIHTPTSTAMVSQAPILQLITTTSNAGSTLTGGITTQSSTGTLLKTPSGSSMMAAGQPLLIQLPLSMTNGQGGMLVNIPVSSLSAATSHSKAKTTTTTTTFILKPASAITTSSASGPTVATVPSFQASTGMVSPTQISIARALFQGGAGGITTPNAGVSVTTARAPAQSVSVAGAMSSASSPATSGPAATGSTAPGPPQGTSLTSKTDNQATVSTPSKAAAPGSRPKGSVIDLTEDDDDVQVTGVKNATAAAPSPTQRPNPVLSTPSSAGARSSPQSNPQLTVHHRPPLDSPLKSRAVTTTTPTRGSIAVLPPLPAAPALARLPPEAERSSPPQQPQLKLVPSQTGIVLSWCVSETDRTCAAVDSYHLYAFHQDNSNSGAAQQHWKKIGEVKALPLPMACTLTQFQSGSTYHFAVRAKDICGRFGSFCEPQCTNVINSNSS